MSAPDQPGGGLPVNDIGVQLGWTPGAARYAVQVFKCEDDGTGSPSTGTQLLLGTYAPGVQQARILWATGSTYNPPYQHYRARHIDLTDASVAAGGYTGFIRLLPQSLPSMDTLPPPSFGSISSTGAATLMGGRLVFTEEEFDIEANSTAGNDKQVLTLSGGGNDDVSRGGVIKISGINCSSSETPGSQGAGEIDLFAGNSSASHITMHTSEATERFRVTADGNVAMLSTAAYGSAFGSFGGGVLVMFLGNAATLPSSGTGVTGGGVVFVSSGALCWMGSSGTITTIAPA